MVSTHPPIPEASVPITLRAPSSAARGVLVCAACLVLAVPATSAHGQAGKVSPTNEYQVSLACGGGVAREPGPNGGNYTSAGVGVFDSERKGPAGPVVYCGKSVDIGGSWAALITWNVFVFDTAHNLVKQCGNEPYTPLSGGRFPCKAGGNVSATLTIKPR